MIKKKYLILIQELLKGSPRNTIRRYNQIFPHDPISFHTLPTDQQYLKKFLSLINYSELQTLYQSNPNIIHNRNFQTKKPQTKGQIILNMISQFNKNNIEIYKFQQSRQFINSLSQQQCKTMKINLGYLYRILVKKNQNLPYLYQGLNQPLIQTIMKKLWKQGQKNDNQSKDTSKYLDILNQARNDKEIGNLQSCQKYYQTLYNDKQANDNIRAQALTYLCYQSSKKNDKTYLYNMLVKIKEEGNEQLQKYMLSLLQKIGNTQNQSK